MSEEVTPVFDVTTALIVGIVLLTILFVMSYCNEKGGICPGKWVFLFLGQQIYDSIDSLILKAIMSQILRVADFIPR